MKVKSTKQNPVLKTGTKFVFIYKMRKHILFPSLAALALISACDTLHQLPVQINLPTVESNVPSQSEVASGLKEALINGISKGTGSLNKPGAFFQNAVRKILLPQEVRDLESKIRNNAVLNAAIGGQLDKAVKAMNDGAENAMGKAMPIFKDAVMNMSFSDAMGILRGGNGAATQYLKNTTSVALQQAFKPVIQQALNDVKITEYWNPIIREINKPLNKTLLGIKQDINPDLNAYVTEKASNALFQEIEQQENAIRANPVERGTALLKKVFDYADSQKK
ncbi:MAG: DUF4197 domain-containing protein [Sphingomonadales bacterium]|nr:DUF4197 domain-containing protein [Sphingomonadales bacterium]